MKTKKSMASAILLLMLGIVLLASGAYLCLKPEVYSATCRIQPARNTIPGLAEAEGSNGLYFLQTEFGVIQSEAVLDKVINALDLNKEWGQKYHHSEGFTTSQIRRLLRNRLELRVQGPGAMEVSVCSDDKTEASKIANALADAYRDYRQAGFKQRTLAVIKEQETQLEEVKGKIKKLEEALAPVDTGAEPVVPVAVPVVHHEQAKNEAETEYLKQEKLLNDLKQLTPEELRQALPVIAPDETLSRLLQERTSAENQVITLGQSLEETDPELLRATQAVATLDMEIDNRIQGILQARQILVASLKAQTEKVTVKNEETKKIVTNAPVEKRSVEVPRDVRLSYELRELQHARDVLEAGMSRLPVSTIPQVKIIERAEPPNRPIFPNRAVGIALLIAAIVTDGAGLRLLMRGVPR